MRFLFIADPTEKLKKKADSTLAMLRAALAQGIECFWAVDTDISALSHRVRVKPVRVESCAPDELPMTRPAGELFIDDFDVVQIRKDPPFDMNYIQLCWVLSYAETKTYFMNRPSLLVRYHEKILPLEAVAQGFLKDTDIIPTYFGNWEAAKEHFQKHGTEQIIIKPFWGFGGSDVTKIPFRDFVKLTETRGALRDQIVQPFIPDVVKGDRRVFLLDGEILADVVRVPPPGGFISNFAQGGTGAHLPLGDKEREALERLGKFLKYAGIHLAGADVIGDRISEVNITSPTGLRAIQMLQGKDYAEDIVRFAQKNAFYGRN